MIKEEIGYGETVEEAWEQAKINLIAAISNTKFNEDDIQFDVIATPKKKTFGLFGGAKAEVKAFIELPDAPVSKKAKPVKEKKAEKSAEKKAVVKEKAEPVDTLEVNAVPAVAIAADTKAGRAIKYISDILDKLGCTEIEIKVTEKENGAILHLSGEGLGVVIGRRGETLDSLQYLTSLAANDAGGGYYKVTLNIGNYRERREQTLTSLAKRVSNQVLRTGRSRTLEPMNPYERRIIHTAVQEIAGVSSHSVGEGAGRRVVISSDKGGRSQNPKKSSSVADNARAPKSDTDLPLYGKIN